MVVIWREEFSEKVGKEAAVDELVGMGWETSEETSEPASLHSPVKVVLYIFFLNWHQL